MTNYFIKKVLAAVDMSDTSLNAVHFAASVAKEHGASLLILNVIEPSFTMDVNGSFIFPSPNANMNVLSALAATIEHSNFLEPQVIQVNGHVVESIISTAMTEHCDLIVLGTYGASGPRPGFVGTNAYNVIKYSPSPVLIVPPKCKHCLFKKILFPVRPITGALMPYDIIRQFLPANSNLDILALSYLRMERQTSVVHKIADEVNDNSSADKVKVDVTWGKGVSIADDVLQHERQTRPDLILLNSALDASSKPDFIGPQVQRIIHTATTPIVSVKHLGVPILVD
jgi:nucleotide-binding universal stress UspA family protein